MGPGVRRDDVGWSRVPGAMQREALLRRTGIPVSSDRNKTGTPALQRTASQERSLCSGRAKPGPECAALRPENARTRAASLFINGASFLEEPTMQRCYFRQFLLRHGTSKLQRRGYR